MTNMYENQAVALAEQGIASEFNSKFSYSLILFK